MADVDSQGAHRTLLSSDGSWWWNGRAWVSALTEDGLWRWDGGRWQPTVELDGARPRDLASTLALLAEERYAEAGAILAARSSEWNAEAHLRELVGRSVETHQHLRAVEEQMGAATPSQGIGAVLGRLGVGAEERRHLQDDRDRLAAELRLLMAQIGRGAPQPSVKEADEILATARSLDDRAALLGASVAQLADHERARSEAVAAAQRELARTVEAREEALQEAGRAVDAAEMAQAAAVEQARARLRRVRVPGPGELVAEVGPLRLFGEVLETPDGRLTTAGSSALAGGATELWTDHRDLLADLMLLESAGSHAFHEALTSGSDQLFLLVSGRAGASLWPCAPGEEAAARRFAAALAERAPAALQAREEREAESRKAEAEVLRATRDRSAVEAAEAEVARVEADSGLEEEVEAARARLAAAEAETPELAGARETLERLVAQATAPPAPLGTAGPDVPETP